VASLIFLKVFGPLKGDDSRGGMNHLKEYHLELALDEVTFGKTGMNDSN
jgi:hypothetical protein